jgi:hypothetical protein
MHYPNFLRSKYVRFAMIPAALLCVSASGCTDEQATGPRVPSVRRTDNVSFNQFFLAWSQNYSSSPIQTQLFAIDTRQDRQFAPFEADVGVLAFARSHPGRIYINGDEIDQYCVAPSAYAVMYHDFVAAMRSADPTARFSPSGFAEPNDHCCPEPVTDACRQLKHSINFADDFYYAYVQRYGSPPPVHEWRFHDFGITIGVGDVDGWWERVQREVAWSVSHGANMVLGAWGFPGWVEPMSEFQEDLKVAFGRIMNDERITGAVYWTYQPWIHSRHYLMTDDGSLTVEGQTFVNPLTDIPTGLKIVSSANGYAQLRWSNTTFAWGSEVEFWVQAPGASSFVYKKTELASAPGSVQSPYASFNAGDKVKARVRYYNRYGQAEWSPFSNVVSMSSDATSSGISRKNPVFCFLQLC